MIEYTIKPYSFEQAKKLNVVIKPSRVRGKKIDVFKDNKKIASIGEIGYMDFATIIEHDKELAEKKRKAYLARHKHTKDIPNTPSFYASRILW